MLQNPRISCVINEIDLFSKGVNVKDRFSFADPNLPNGLTSNAKVKRSCVELNRWHDPVMGIDRGAEWKPGKGARDGSRRHGPEALKQSLPEGFGKLWKRLTQPLAPLGLRGGARWLRILKYRAAPWATNRPAECQCGSWCRCRISDSGWQDRR